MTEKETKAYLANVQSIGDVKCLAIEVQNNPKIFTLLWNVICTGEQPMAWHAAWVLDHSTVQHPYLLAPITTDLYTKLPLETHPGMKRLLFKLLLRCDLQIDLCVPMINIALEWLQNPKEAMAVRGLSVLFLEALCKKEPDFRFEFEAIIREQLSNSPSPGLTNVIKHTLKRLKAIGV